MQKRSFACAALASCLLLSSSALAVERVDGPPSAPSTTSGWVASTRECSQGHGPPVREMLWSKHDDDFRRHSAIAVAGEILRVELSATLNVVAVTNTSVYLRHTDGSWFRYDLSRGEGEEAERALRASLHARGLPESLVEECLKRY